MKGKIRYKISLTLIVMFFFFLPSAATGQDPYWKEKTEYELELKFSFPCEDLEKEEIYFSDAKFISNDHFGNIFVSDSKANTIFKFDSNGNFLEQFGRQGQGPGEFNRPHEIIPTHKYLVVHDSSNHRIQFLDLKGKYVKGFSLQKSCWDIAINSDGLIFAAPILRQPQTYLIEVYSPEGELLYSFGEPKNFKHRYLTFNQVRIVSNNKGKVLVAFIHWPEIRKYSPGGELEAEYRIGYKPMKELENYNLKQEKPATEGQPGVSKHVIDGFYSPNEGFFLLFNHSRTEILEIDKNGKLKSVFWLKPENDYLPLDFLVLKREGENLFYLLQVYPDNKVDVFRVKKP